MMSLLPCLPATSTTLREWAADCGRRHTHPKTIKSYMTALRSAHVDFGLGSIAAFSDLRLQRVINGKERERGGINTKERLSITKEVLIGCLQAFDTSYLYRATVYAAFCLALAGFLPLGEISLRAFDTSPL